MTSTLHPALDVRETLQRGATAPTRPVPAPPAYGARGRAARWALGHVVRKAPVAVRLPDDRPFGHAALPGVGEPTVDLHRPEAFFARVGASPMIGLGESYMARDWDAAPGTDLADILTPFAERLTDLIPPVFYRVRHAVLPRLRGKETNTKDGSRENVHRHYDLSNEMFALFLDPTMSYSCALFGRLDVAPTSADHHAAQLGKIDAVLDAARVRSGTRLLEVGTGWGSLAIRAAQRGATVTTLTISAQQAQLARTRIADAGMTDRVEVALRDYRDEHGQYDAVVSVEMVEAVGEEFWPDYFAKIDEVLAPGGRAAVQAILLEHHRLEATRDTYGWIQKYIFPGGLLPSVQAIDAVLRKHTRLRTSHVHRIGPHYAHTLRLWRERFGENWAAVEALGFDETFRRMWEFYFAYCEAGFRSGYLDDAILTLER